MNVYICITTAALIKLLNNKPVIQIRHAPAQVTFLWFATFYAPSTDFCRLTFAASAYNHPEVVNHYIIWYSMVWYGMVWCSMVSYGTVWYGMVWYSIVWYGMVYYTLV